MSASPTSAHHRPDQPHYDLVSADAEAEAQRTIDRLEAVRETVLAKGRSLPAFPQVYLQVTEALQSGRGDLDRIPRS